MITKHNNIRWNELLGDPFTRTLNPLMLEGKGVSFTKLSRTPGATQKVAHEISYDREYVLAFLTKKVIQSLQIKDKQEALDLISEAWNYYEQSWSGGRDA
jgi:hypothetical protein